jgi:hypothetical protein
MGWPADLTWYKLVTDWGSLIGGSFALIAGAALYIIGRAQANATRDAANIQAHETREAAMQQVATATAELNHLKAAKDEEDRRTRIELSGAIHAEAARIEILARMKYDTARRRHSVPTNPVVMQPSAYLISAAGVLREGRGIAILRYGSEIMKGVLGY